MDNEVVEVELVKSPPRAARPAKVNAWLSASNLLALGQVAATLLAAAWTFYLYLEFGRTERQLAADLAKLEVLKAERELTDLNTPKLVPSHEIEVRDLGPASGPDEHSSDEATIRPAVATTEVRGDARDAHTFLVNYEYKLQNAGATANEVTYVVVHAYTAPRIDPGVDTAVRVNVPLEEGNVRWRHRLSHGSIVTESFREGMQFKTPHDPELLFPFVEGGGGTGLLQAGESSAGSLQLVLSAMPGELVAVVAQVGLNGGGEQDTRWQMDVWEILDDDARKLHAEPADDRDDAGRLLRAGNPWRVQR